MLISDYHRLTTYSHSLFPYSPKYQLVYVPMSPGLLLEKVLSYSFLEIQKVYINAGAIREISFLRVRVEHTDKTDGRC